MSKNEPAPEVTLADLQAHWNRLREAATTEARKQACGASQGVWVAVLAGVGLLGLIYLLGWRRGRRAPGPAPALPPATPEPVSAASEPAEPPAAKAAAAAPGLAAVLTPLADSLMRYGLAALTDHLDRTAKRRDK